MLAHRRRPDAPQGVDPTLEPENLFAGLEDAARLLLAVSGGPDSMALLVLAFRWARSRGGPELHVATVDHRLRAESLAEAEMVAEVAASIGLSHAILVWDGPKPKNGLQERARAARYALLSAQAAAVGADVLVTAHHADDQAETVLMRLGRGSGMSGLAGMRRFSFVPGGPILARPLLDCPKAELVDLCRRESIPFVEDPANRDPAFLRARLRRDAEAATRLGLGRDNLVRLARRLARADRALEAETDRVEAALSPDVAPGAYRADLARLAGAGPEIVLRLLRRAVSQVGGTREIGLESLERIADEVSAALLDGVALRTTLAGTLLRLDAEGRLEIVPEPPRSRGRGRPGERAAIKAELTR